MRIAICDNSRAAAEQLGKWVEQYCVLYHLTFSLQCFSSADSFSACSLPFDIVYLAFGGDSGFFQARLLRERDKDCQIILVDDTREYIIRSVRIHCTDFILRPVTFEQIVRSMNLATGGGA